MDSHSSFQQLPPEVRLHVLSFLGVDDLLQLSRTSLDLRNLACDPLLHLERIHHASRVVDRALAARPSRAAISPPHAWIWLSKTNVLSKQISKSLTKIRLSHNLERRPTVQDLVARAILPATCTSVSPGLIQSHRAIQKQRLKDGLGRKLGRRPSVHSLVSLNILPEECATRRMSPTIIAKRRQVMRETLKDGLRAWVEGRGLQAQKRKADEMEFIERRTVKSLAKRFTAKKLAVELETSTDRVDLENRKARARWGREVEVTRRKEERRATSNSGCSHPTRAHVLGLKRFWEGVIRSAAV
jgi:hypothetical protein